MADSSQTKEEPTQQTKADDKEILQIDDSANNNENKNDNKNDEPVTKNDDPIAKNDTKSDEKKKNDNDDHDDGKDDNKTEQKDDVESSSSDDMESDDDLIDNVEDWDLTLKLSQYFDKHFVIQLLNNLQRLKNPNKKSKNTNTIQETKSDEKDDTTQTQQPPTHSTFSLKPTATLARIVSQFSDEDLHKMKLSLLSKTCLVDERMTIFDELHKNDENKETKEKEKESLIQYKQDIMTKLKAIEEKIGTVLDFFGDTKVIEELIHDRVFDLDELARRFPDLKLVSGDGNVTFDVDDLFVYCRLRYEIGAYEHTDVLLNYYRLLCYDKQKKTHALWGEFSIQILLNKWDDASSSIRLIKENIELSSRTLRQKDEVIDDDQEDEYTKMARENAEKAAKEAALLEIKENEEVNFDDDKDDDREKRNFFESQAKSLRNREDSPEDIVKKQASLMRDRAWVLHWSLFVYFNNDSGLRQLIDLYQDKKYMNVIQTLCPHLLRYLASAIIISPNIKSETKLSDLTEISRIIIEEQYNYRDPILEFVRLLIRTNDFDGASVMLSNAMDVVRSDFFLSYYYDYFLQFARTSFLKKYCRLYNVINLKDIARMLLMGDSWDNDRLQIWIINAFRNEKISAKLDVVENVLYVNFEQTNPYQQMTNKTVRMIERTKFMNTRIKELIRDAKIKAEEEQKALDNY